LNRRLYDNLDETDILSEVEAWDRQDFERRGQLGRSPHPTGNAQDAHPRLVDGHSIGMQALAQQLASKVRNYNRVHSKCSASV
jgi:hypothetical protein